MSRAPDAADLAACELLWHFNAIQQPLDDPDAILVMGSNDLHVAVHAAAIAKNNARAVIVCSGGLAHRGDLLDPGWDQPEADVLANEMVREGIDPAKILRERSATNTAENVVRSRIVLEDAKVVVRRLLVMQKPFMARRALLTARHHWPEVTVGVSHESISFAAYSARYGRDGLIDIIAGDTQRLIVYAQRGYHAAVEIPPAVQAALGMLIARGYTAHMPV